jgi:ribosomal protein L37AE/L43A
MTETIAPVDKPVSRPRSRKPASVSASALALHLNCTRCGKVAVSRSTRAALPICDTCGSSGSNYRAVGPTLMTSRPKPSC